MILYCCIQDSTSGKNPDIYFERHPTVDETLADFLIASEIKMLGLDMPAPDHPPFSVHKKLLTAGIFILENLTGLERLNGVGEFEVIALPLKIEAEASLVRAVARTMLKQTAHKMDFLDYKRGICNIIHIIS